MNATSCILFPPIQTLLICVSLIGFIVGLTLARLVMVADRQWQNWKERRLRLSYEKAALAQLEQQQAIDTEMDERLMCKVCWQEQHPGQRYPLSGPHLCREHVAHLAQKEVDESGAKKIETHEEVCA